MRILEKEKFVKKIEDALYDIFTEICEGIEEPAGSGCGFGIHDSAQEKAAEMIFDLHELMNEIGESKDYLYATPTIKDLIEEIESNQENNISDSLKYLEEIDSFVRDAGEDKYQYLNTVYKVVGTIDHICVEEQRARVGHDDFITVSITASTVEKKENVTYEWI